MAYSCVTRNVYTVLPLLILLSITPLSSSFSPSDKVTIGVLAQLCAEPRVYDHFCAGWLAPDPETFTLDISGLVDLVLQKTQLFAYKNLAMMKGLVRTTTDPTLKAPYTTCVTGYELAIRAIEGAQTFATSRSYQLASQAASEAFDSISSCEAGLKGRQNVPAYVPQRNLLFGRMCTIDSVFSSVLKS
ncbi:hypothetical protein N665_0368s0045 [Sinapis alba]|nr:hypothetical protein N665_0368s0045 [Sinapis alba]